MVLQLPSLRSARRTCGRLTGQSSTTEFHFRSHFYLLNFANEYRNIHLAYMYLTVGHTTLPTGTCTNSKHTHSLNMSNHRWLQVVIYRHIVTHGIFWFGAHITDNVIHVLQTDTLVAPNSSSDYDSSDYEGNSSNDETGGVIQYNAEQHRKQIQVICHLVSVLRHLIKGKLVVATMKYKHQDYVTAHHYLLTPALSVGSLSILHVSLSTWWLMCCTTHTTAIFVKNMI